VVSARVCAGAEVIKKPKNKTAIAALKNKSTAHTDF